MASMPKTLAPKYSETCLPGPATSRGVRLTTSCMAKIRRFVINFDVFLAKVVFFWGVVPKNINFLGTHPLFFLLQAKKMMKRVKIRQKSALLIKKPVSVIDPRVWIVWLRSIKRNSIVLRKNYDEENLAFIRFIIGNHKRTKHL
jgi:hypothetical protein